jgi:hypothetical protein
MGRNANADWLALGDVILGCVNQAGEDYRNVAGMPEGVPGVAVARVAPASMRWICRRRRSVAGPWTALWPAGRRALLPPIRKRPGGLLPWQKRS